jgi:hypothetical protein
MRSAQDKERVSTHDSSFDSMTLVPNKAATRIQNLRIHDPVILGTDDVNRLQEALRAFRGTLIDGVLQPNVRLGNGLDLYSPPKQVATRPRSKRHAHAEGLQRATTLRAQLDVNSVEQKIVSNDLALRHRVEITKDIEIRAETPEEKSPSHVEHRACPANTSKTRQKVIQRRGAPVRKDRARVKIDIPLGAEAPKARPALRVERRARLANPNELGQVLKDRSRIHEHTPLGSERPEAKSPSQVERRACSANPSKPSQVRGDGIRIKKGIPLTAKASKAKSPSHVGPKARPAIPNKSNQEDIIQRATLKLQAAESRLRDKEKELQLKEETLRWKYRAWSLEKQLVKQQHFMSSQRRRTEERHPRSLGTPRTNMPYTATEEPQNASLSDPWLPRTGDAIPSSKSSKATRRSRSAKNDVNTPNTPPKTPRRPLTIKESPPQSDLENTRDPSPSYDFNLNEHTPPAALATLRSHLAIPGRRRRGPRPP